MAIRLTESRLRQIIREEALKANEAWMPPEYRQKRVRIDPETLPPESDAFFNRFLKMKDRDILIFSDFKMDKPNFGQVISRPSSGLDSLQLIDVKRKDWSPPSGMPSVYTDRVGSRTQGRAMWFIVDYDGQPTAVFATAGEVELA